ncbi:MAG: glycosyltransferase family 2 protein [Rhodanobacteraceae bacterium]|nr:glycosyltransferase family 2 protein [Rhodanobacteraceae bacterium]
MNAASAGRVLAVVVTYNAVESTLEALLRSLLGQVETVFVVDNTPPGTSVAEHVVERIAAEHSRLVFRRMHENVGIAAALNVGIRYAIDDSFDAVLLSDQDSLPAGDMVPTLLGVLGELSRSGLRAGAVSPLYLDQVTGQAFGFQVQRPGKLFYSIAGEAEGSPWIEVLSGISSGTLVPVDVFQDVGLMREDYFIDYVDTEWFHRVRYHGFKIFGTSQTALTHQLGDSCFQVWYFGWRPFNGYSPQRLYYRFRNFVALLKEPHTSLRWKLRATWYWLGNAYAYLIFSPRRWHNFRYISSGLWDGLRGHMGRLDD